MPRLVIGRGFWAVDGKVDGKVDGVLEEDGENLNGSDG
jgi:hypothetical protein